MSVRAQPALRTTGLLLDSISSSEHVVNASEVVCAREKVLGATFGSVVLLEVGAFAKIAHLHMSAASPIVCTSTYIIISLRRDNTSSSQALVHVDLLLDFGDAAFDLQGEERGGKAAAVAENTHALAGGVFTVDVGEQAHQAAVHASTVHVSAHGRHLNAGLDAGSEALLGKAHEGLLNRLVRHRGLVVETLQFCGHLRENGVLWVGEVVIVEQACVRLGYELARWRVEAHVIKPVERRLLLLRVAVNAIDTIGTVRLGLERLLTLVVCLVAGIDCLGVAPDREVAVHNGVLARQVRLVEIVGMSDVGAAQACVKDQGSIRSNEHSHTACTAGRAGISLLVQRNITSHHHRVTAVPRRRLEPTDRVENGIRAAVARVDRVYTLDVEVAGFCKQLHEDRLDRLGLVEQRLGAHLETANRLGIDIVFLEQGGQGRQGERIHI